LCALTFEQVKEIEMAITHLSEDGFGSVLPDDVEWRPFPPGLYATRVKVPSGVKLMPHTHPEDRIYTVISGVFYIGLGEHFDAAKLQAYPPGAVVVLPRDTAHFHCAQSGEYVTQISAIGPLGLDYVDPSDDPRHS
jgi:quercetin dioxygenase-like cupin family protein